MSKSNVFSSQFINAVHTHLSTNAVDGAAVTRSDLAKLVRKLAGKRNLDEMALNAFISASVNLGFFDSEEGQCGTKRGVSGGITYVQGGKVRRPRKAKAVQVTPVPMVFDVPETFTYSSASTSPSL